MGAALTAGRAAAWGLAGLLAGLGGCAAHDGQRVTPGARVIYHGGKFAVFSICDRGNRLYLTEEGDTVTVVPGGCPDGQP